MNMIKQSLINFLNLFLYDENRRKEFEKFNSQMDIYKNMPPDELKFEYILLNGACGHFFRPLCLYSFYNLED